MSEHDHEHGSHEHDLGLLYDLETMRTRWALLPQAINRRNALRLLGAAGAGLALAACGGNKKDSAASTTTNLESSTTTGGANATTATTAAGSSATATRSPSETGGPYPADGTNGPNVLSESGVVRSDITKSFGKYSGTAAGVPITANLKIVRAGTGAAFSGAAMYLWHCDAEAGYSLYSDAVTDQNYLRGVQAADSSGMLTFKTIFPAAYSGRYPHFHYEIFTSLNDAAKGSSKLLTSQIALPEAACNEVFKDASAYPGSASNMQRTTLTSDGVFRDSYQTQLASMTGSPSSGYTLTYTVVV